MEIERDYPERKEENLPEISIIIPVYNISEYIEKSVNKILNQNYKDFELILVNDGSTDDSFQKCNLLQKRDSRIKVINKKNEGAGPSRNIGIKESSGRYIMFLDGDDFIEENMLTKMYDEIVQNNSDLVICNFNQVQTNGEKTPFIKNLKDYKVSGKIACRKSYIDLLNKGLIKSPWNKLYKAEIIKINNITFPNLRRCQDAVFNCRYFEYVSDYKVIGECLYNYKINSLQDEWTKFPKDYFDISIVLNNTYIDAVTRWEQYTIDNIEFLSNYFINDVLGCMQFSYSPNWEFNWKERKQYIENLINHEKTQELVYTCNYDSKYKRLMCFLIKKKYSLLCIIVVKCVLGIRTRFNFLFDYLKRIF